MFICLDCGNVFEELKQCEERHPYGDGYASEYFSYSPCCNGDYSEAERCDECGEYFAVDELNDGWCEHCLAEYIEYCEDKVVDIIHNQITKEEFDRLPDEFLDNVWEKLYQKYYSKKEIK